MSAEKVKENMFKLFWNQICHSYFYVISGSFRISESIQALSDVSPGYEGSPEYQSLSDEVHRGFFDHSPELYPMVPEQKYRPPPNMCRGK